jgi:predicted nucleic acid-binding protein
MATTVADQLFVDTSILVYSTITSAPLYANAVQSLGDLRRDGTPLWVSRQILREYIAAVTRPQSFTQPLAPAVVVADIAYFQSVFHLAEDSAAVTAQLVRLLQTVAFGGKQVHDANIVATMLAHGIPKLLTHNTPDFARFASIITVVPLVP